MPKSDLGIICFRGFPSRPYRYTRPLLSPTDLPNLPLAFLPPTLLRNLMSQYHVDSRSWVVFRAIGVLNPRYSLSLFTGLLAPPSLLDIALRSLPFFFGAHELVVSSVVGLAQSTTDSHTNLMMTTTTPPHRRPRPQEEKPLVTVFRDWLLSTVGPPASLSRAVLPHAFVILWRRFCTLRNLSCILEFLSAVSWWPSHLHCITSINRLHNPQSRSDSLS